MISIKFALWTFVFPMNASIIIVAIFVLSKFFFKLFFPHHLVLFVGIFILINFNFSSEKSDNDIMLYAGLSSLCYMHSYAVTTTH